MFYQCHQGAMTNYRCLDLTLARPTELEPPGDRSQGYVFSKGSTDAAQEPLVCRQFGLHGIIYICEL